MSAQPDAARLSRCHISQVSIVDAAGSPQTQSTVQMAVPESLGCFAHSPITAADAEFLTDTLRSNARWLRAQLIRW